MHVHNWQQSIFRKDQKFCDGCRSWLFKGVVVNSANLIDVGRIFTTKEKYEDATH